MAFQTHVLCGFRCLPALASFADANLLDFPPSGLYGTLCVCHMYVLLTERSTAVILCVKGGACER